MKAVLTPAVPLSEEEKKLLAPCLIERGLSLDLLELLVNVPERTRLIKVYSDSGRLLGLTNVLVTPSLFMKHAFGPGNHLGTNTTFFFTQKDQRAEILKALFKKLLESFPFGYYVGFIDPEVISDFSQFLKKVPHVVAQKVLEAGSISVSGKGASKDFLARHKHLRRHVKIFEKAGGKIEIHTGDLSPQLAHEIVTCCLHSYRKNIHPGVPIDISSYGEEIYDFLVHYKRSVVIATRCKERLTGVQIFLRHTHHLELTEGGFLPENFKASENIVLASVRFCEENQLERVSYGLVLNETKDRLMDQENRQPLYLVMFFAQEPEASQKEAYELHAHERFSRLFWKNSSPSRHSLFSQEVL